MSSPSAQAAFSLVIQHEGGYSNTPGDTGGPTKWGITQADLAEYLGHAVTAEDVENMAQDTAIDIYGTKYWAPLSLDSIVKPELAAIIFDQGILRGTETVSNDLKAVFGVTDAGLMPASLLTAINGCDQTHLGVRFLIVSRNHLIAISQAHSNDAQFLKGWVNRIDSCEFYYFGIQG